MKIEDYLASSRRTRPPTPELSSQYHQVFNTFIGYLSDDVVAPKLVVTHSTARQPENVTLGGVNYVIYDQYLGQSFARLNRILFAGSERDELAMSYANKYLAEQGVVRGRLDKALIFALSSKKILSDLGPSPFVSDAQTDDLRAMLTDVQECFVLGHEIGHFLQKRLGVDAEASETLYESVLRDYEFIGSQRHGGAGDLSGLMSPGQRLVYEQMRTVSALKQSPDQIQSRVLGFLATYKDKIVRELYCDCVGLDFTFSHLVVDHGMAPEIVSMGVALALRYLRFFEMLRNLAREIDEVPALVAANANGDESTRLRNALMKGTPGASSVLVTQVRERSLRRQTIATVQEFDESIDLEELNRVIHTIIFDYEEHIEDEITYFLPDRIASVAQLLGPGRTGSFVDNESPLDAITVDMVLYGKGGWEGASPF